MNEKRVSRFLAQSKTLITERFRHTTEAHRLVLPIPVFQIPVLSNSHHVANTVSCVLQDSKSKAQMPCFTVFLTAVWTWGTHSLALSCIPSHAVIQSPPNPERSLVAQAAFVQLRLALNSDPSAFPPQELGLQTMPTCSAFQPVGSLFTCTFWLS